MSKDRRHKLRLVGAPPAPARQAVAGKVTHDSRGNAVWDWALDTGVLARKTAAELLGSLDKPGLLTLEGETPEVEHEWSGDPYNRTSR
jgi:hypothetical protein